MSLPNKKATSLGGYCVIGHPVLICIKNPSLFDPCINISNKVILVFSCIALCFCFYVFSMFHFYCIVMYIDVCLSHPNKDYLLTYLLNLAELNLHPKPCPWYSLFLCWPGPACIAYMRPIATDITYVCVFVLCVGHTGELCRKWLKQSWCLFGADCGGLREPFFRWGSSLDRYIRHCKCIQVSDTAFHQNSLTSPLVCQWNYICLRYDTIW